MFRNYLKTAFRNITRHKGFSFINITGLAIGLAACILIIQYVNDELNYDSFHKDAGQLYRLQLNRVRNGVEDKSAGTAPGLGPALKENFPEVAAFARYKSMDYMNNLVEYNETRHNQSNVFFADSNFLSLFNFTTTSGNAVHALDEPNTAVITQSAATRYFGNADPVGKIITITNDYGKTPYKITALLKNLPGNTHISYNLLLSYSTLIKLDPNAKSTLGWNAFFTYIKLKPGTATSAFESKMNRLVTGLLAKDLEEFNYSVSLQLQPVTGIHLSDIALRHDTEIKGSRKTINILAIVALFIITIAYFNYINLATSRAANRAKEVGIRKVAGSGKWQLVKQFLFESAVLNCIAFVLAVFFVQLFAPMLEEITGKSFSFSSVFTGKTGWVVLGIFLAGSLLSGIYPAFILTSFKPVAVLKGKTIKIIKGSWLRKGLVITQFTASALLIAGTLAVYKQVSFMRHHDLGINIDQTLVIKAPAVRDGITPEKKNAFTAAVSNFTGIKNITASTEIPGNEITWVNNIFKTGPDGQKNSYSAHFLGVDDQFLPSYNIALMAGRNFNTGRPADKDAVILSETAMSSFGYTDPQDAIGRQLEGYGQRALTIIGIARDYHQTSLKTNLKPIVYTMAEFYTNYYSVKIQTADGEKLQAAMSGITAQWKSFFPSSPLEHFFLDEFFNRQYQADKQFGTIFSLFSSLAIFIACLGLFGLVSYSTLQRTREIGIRKVLGASVPGILNLLSKDFIRLVLIANILAIPLIYLSINKWLENYPYRIQVSWWFFVLPAIIVLLVALLTVSFQTIKTANMNPVKSLRTE